MQKIVEDGNVASHQEAAQRAAQAHCEYLRTLNAEEESDELTEFKDIPDVFKTCRRPQMRNVGVQVNLPQLERQPQPTNRYHPHYYDNDDVEYYFPSGNLCTIT